MFEYIARVQLVPLYDTILIIDLMIIDKHI